MTSRRSSLTTRTVKHVATLLTAVLASAGLAACADNSSDYEYSASFTPKSASPVDESSEMAAPSSSPSSEASHDPEPTRSTQGSSPRNCGVDKEASEIYAHISDVPDTGLLPDNRWKYRGDSNYDPCADLTYAALYQEGTHASTPSQLMLFHQGEYLGVGSDQLLNPIEFLEVTDSSITIRYKDWNAWSEARASYAESPNYYTDITYRWDGEKVQMLGYVPE